MIESKVIYFVSGLFIIYGHAKSQVTESEARPIDSLLANTYLISPVIHNYNVNPTLNGPVLTWDAANGFYGGNPNLSVAWSFTHRVHADTADQINEVTGAYGLFDLSIMQDAQAYEDSVSYWLQSIGIPVSIKEDRTIVSKLFPNPTKGYIKIEANLGPGERCRISICDLSGKQTEVINAISIDKVLSIHLDLNNYKSGIYIIEFENNRTSFSQKLVIN